MSRHELFWQQVIGRAVSRRGALRAVALGAAGVSGLRFPALAQTAPLPAPAAPTVAPVGERGYLLHLPQVPSAVIPADVVARKGNQRAWPLLQGVSIAQVEVPVGSWRSMHLHTNTPELAVVLKGTARAALQNPQKEWTEVDLQEGDCVYFPLGWPHWFRNTGDGVLQAYFNYGHELPVTVELQG